MVVSPRLLLGVLLVIVGLAGGGWSGTILLWAWAMWEHATDPSYSGLAGMIAVLMLSLGTIIIGVILCMRRRPT